MPVTEIISFKAGNGASVEISLHGGQVISWRTPDGRERLFLSRLAEARAGTAIRGGIPVIFPQFADFGPLPKHGFARTQAWTLIDSQSTGTAATARLSMVHNAETTATWPHQFALDLVVSIGGYGLGVELAVRNTGAAAFHFTAALHTYLALDDIEATTVLGLADRPYTGAAGGIERVDGNVALKIHGEIDRIYRAVAGSVVVKEGHHETEVAASGFPDVVVWNPGQVRGAGLADLEPDGYRRMLCVEAAVVATPITLGPAGVWQGQQRLTVLR